jgi:hypothetical protein
MSISIPKNVASGENVPAGSNASHRFQIGTVSSCVEDLVVVQSLPGVPAIDLVSRYD